ncbi:crotonase/enoyl-CoA hydratase family protein [Sphingorhabdus sp.]|jgi:enoyl-CoA hydratase/carnithine racemase|uniref:crotonase/enoyl-CoA hydratase family protein n=1 Tax=Sphingorhabdus sp. TaxID=1902408 RepID=UPI0037C64B9A
MNDRVSISIDNHVADVRLTRADKMNALDPGMFQGIIAAGEELAALKGVRAVVLSGEGRSFCAGLDMASMANGGASANSGMGSLADRTHGNANTFQQVAMLWRKLPMPVIAAVHGVCFGGGLQIASGADIRVVAPDARMAVMEMKWGLIPDMGGYALWRGMVREDMLRELTYTNREFSGAEAFSLGFATFVDENPHSRALAIAREIADRNPEAMREAKALFNEYADMDEDTILIAESVRQARVIRKPNQVEAVMAGMQKRPGVFAD